MLSELERTGELTCVRVSYYFLGMTGRPQNTVRMVDLLPEIHTRQLLSMSQVLLLDLIFGLMKKPLIGIGNLVGPTYGK
jgi:hypothetical protein